MKELRPYQIEALQAIRDTVRSRVYRICVQAPTGSGKTLIAADIANGAKAKGNPLVFLVPRITLIDQTVEAFYAEGITDVGVIQADHPLTDWSKSIQVASIQTVRSKGKYPAAAVVLIDECHELHKAHIRWMQDPEWVKVPFIGLSATPWTTGLGKYFDTLLVMSTTQELIDQGYLSKFRVFAADSPDLSNVEVKRGDYVEDQLSTVMSEQQLTANIIETWRTKWGKDKTLCFGVDCAHAQLLRDRFLDAGIAAAYQDAFTKDAERAAIKRGFHDGTYRVVCSVGTLTTGVDWDVRCISLARPTKSEILFVQIVGRGLRPADGKDYCLILDHTDTTLRLGFVTDIQHERLSMGKMDSNKSVSRSAPLPKPCPQCACLMAVGQKVCAECGFERKITSSVVERDGQLVEFTGNFRKKGTTNPQLLPYTYEEKQRYYRQLRGYALMKGYKPGWAFMKFKDKFGESERPPWSWNNLEPMNPGPEVTQWIRSQNIRWARSPDNPKNQAV